ncbi:hypothetical protein JCM11641_000516 [Rhodosporidiobolus odoratus]
MSNNPEMAENATPRRPVIARIDFSGVRGHTRQSSSASSIETIPEDSQEKAVAPEDTLAGTDSPRGLHWAPPLATAPALAYRQSSSGSSIISSSDTLDSLPRKRFKAPFRSQVLDREVGNAKPWMNGRTRITRDKKSYFTTLFGITAGVACGLYAILSGVLSRDSDEQWCPVLHDDFQGESLDMSKWRIEQRIGGGESNDFTWFTGHNSYVADGNLWIVPTLTNDTMLSSDYAVLNSTYMQLGSVCDSIHTSDCFIQADTENNKTLVVPPVQSAMISTRNKVTINQGRVVVRAKMPTGDWLWPQISMVPQDEEYGAYPASGLISLFESRGNIAQARLDQLNNEMITGLHVGPAGAPSYDRFFKFQGLYKVYRNFFNQRYYEFGMDWTDHSITVWVNTRVRIAFRYGFGTKTFWDVGNFGYAFSNGTVISNPWAAAENTHTAPFDKPFYLRIALLAGGTDGYWLDTLPNKPWRNSDDRPQAMQRFLDYLGVWFPSWPGGEKIRNRGLAIDSVRMYQKRTTAGC